ncbi:uncharacterized protein LOC102676587 isoform X1 [Apis dorsata]|uniref:uncharacterized protein LOC102676587 isoform X1 n=1 Tax=Apis dorsata TaxID=7462 RepID=UPI001293AB97|nr:uncharacterized protein LOC102676587 isoform X1 [Apis dorsata]
MHPLRHITAIEAGLLFGRTRDTGLIGSINEHSASGWRSIMRPRKDFSTHSLCYTWTIAMRRFLLLSLLFTSQHSGSCLERDKRYLVFPTPGTNAPTKVQFILGLGLPMEVDVSTIIGYVMKFNYALPYNASYLTDSYVRYDRSISPGVEVDGDDEPNPDYQGVARALTRWEIYEILESALGDSRSGKACLLRAICEASASPFDGVHGLASQLVHLLLTPSTTSEALRTDFDRVYHAAEIMGRRGIDSCDTIFPECEESPLDYFTEVHQRFG